MANIKDCINQRIKISKGSITIKNENDKTCGIVKNIISLYDLQPNKQIEYYSKLKKMGLHGNISIKNCIIHDNNLYVFRNIKHKLFQKQYGYFSEDEKIKAQKEEVFYNTLKTHGIEVIECIFV